MVDYHFIGYTIYGTQSRTDRQYPWVAVGMEGRYPAFESGA